MTWAKTWKYRQISYINNASELKKNFNGTGGEKGGMRAHQIKGPEC